jgi:DNA-binding IclR family transcriptional regulator
MSVMNSAAQVIRLLAHGGPELTFGDVVHGLNLPKSTVSRLLAQMSRLGLLERDESTRRFRAGLLLLEAAQRYRRGNVLSELAHGSLANLSAETGYTGYLATLDGTDTVVLQRFNGTHPLQIVSPPGTRRPAFMTAMGRVLLSRLPEADFHKRLGKKRAARLPGAPANGPQTVGELLQRIRRARRERSVVVTNDGLPGIAAIACSLSDPSNGDTVGLCLTFLNGLIPKMEVQRVRGLFVSRVEMLGRRVGDPLWCGERSPKVA